MDYSIRLYPEDMAKWIDKNVVSIEKTSSWFCVKTIDGKEMMKPSIMWAVAFLMYIEKMEDEFKKLAQMKDD